MHYGDWMNEFDTQYIGGIINDVDGIQYSWANAHVLRFLDRMLGKIDIDHMAQLWALYPAQVEAVLKWWGWSKTSIDDYTFKFTTILEK